MTHAIPAQDLIGGSIDHLGIVVPDLEAAVPFYRDVMGLEETGRRLLEADGLSVVFLKASQTGLPIELLSPLPGAGELVGLLGDHTVQAFLRRQPAGGLHHICFRTSAFEEAKAKLEANGLAPLGDGQGAVGAAGRRVLFFGPTSPAGIIIEIKEVEAAA